MTGFAIDQLQAAVFSALSGDAALMAIINAIWDEADANAPYPYIALGDSAVRDLSSKSETLSEHKFQIHIWSDAQGRMEVKEIMEQVHNCLHLAPVSLATDKLISMQFIEAKEQREISSNGVLNHATLWFRALISNS